MSRGILLLAVLSLVLIFSFQGDQVSAEPDATLHSMTVFVDSGASENYDYMTWDFGDGTELDSRDSDTYLNPVHTYSETGTYTIVQTVYNTTGATMTDTTSRTVTIAGPPEVTFMSGGEVFLKVTAEDRTTAEYNPVTEPEGEPEMDGMEFDGWVDSDGEEYDWSRPVTAPMVLYASWEPEEEDEHVPEEVPGPVDPPTEGADGGYGLPLATIAAVIAGVMVLTAYVRRS